MRISHKHKFIFFCNPKTGSDSFREMLNPYSEIKVNNNSKIQGEKYLFYTHISPIETKKTFKNLGWHYDDYYKVVCTRNPYNKLVSLYEMIYKRYPNFLKPDFKKWVINTKNNKSGGGGKDHQRWRKYGTYALENFIKDESGKFLVDKVIRLEDFDKEVPKLFKHLKLPEIRDVIKKNVGNKRKETQEYFDKELVSIIKKRYSWELKEFSYDLL